MKPDDLIQVASLYVKKAASPFDTDRTKQSMAASFVAGFMTAQGMWQAEFDKLKANEKQPEATPPPAIILKP